jgi:hypothetical protein
MFFMELDTFVRKFHQLWNDGVTAHLDLDTHAGNAWVGLRVQLDQVPGPPHQQVQPSPQQVHRKFESPSRQRRRARRVAAKAEKASNTAAVEAAVEIENENVTTGGVDKKVSDVAEMSEEIVDGKANEIAAEATVADVFDNLDDEVCSDEEYSKQQKVTGLAIPQVDGTFDEEVVFTFVSDYHREDIEYTIKEVIPIDIESKLTSVVRIGGLMSADQLCTLVIKMPSENKFIWPVMSQNQSEVIKELKTVPNFDPA